MTTITIKAHGQCLIQSFSSIKSRFLYKLSVVKQGTFPSSYLNSGFPGWQDKTALGSLLLGSWFSLHHFLNAASPLFIRVAPVTAVRLARLFFIITPVESSLTSSLRPHRPFFLLAVLRNFPNCTVCSCFFIGTETSVISALPSLSVAVPANWHSQTTSGPQMLFWV